MVSAVQSEVRTPRLLDQVRSALRMKHYSHETEKSYIAWIRQYIHFHHLKHPKDMGEQEIGQFLSHLAVNRNVSASTQNQALCSILFLYKQVLEKDIGELNLVWAKKPKVLPVVLSRQEVRTLLQNLYGVPKSWPCCSTEAD